RLAFSPDGRWLAAASEAGRLRLLEARTGKLAHALTGDLVGLYCVNFSPDSRYLIAGGGSFQPAPGREHRALVWDLRTRKQIARLEGHTRAVIGAAFAPKNALVATSSADNTVRVWDGKTFKLRFALEGHTAPVKGLAFSPDGKVLATGSWDRTVRLWDADGGTLVARLDHPAGVREIAFSPDGKQLVAGGMMSMLKLW